MCVNNLPRVALDRGATEIRTRDLLISSRVVTRALQTVHPHTAQSHSNAWLLSHTTLELERSNEFAVADDRLLVTGPRYSVCAMAWV